MPGLLHRGDLNALVHVSTGRSGRAGIREVVHDKLAMWTSSPSTASGHELAIAPTGRVRARHQQVQTSGKPAVACRSRD